MKLKKKKNLKYLTQYGNVKVALEIEDAALHFDVLQMMSSFRAEKIFLDQFFKIQFVFGKLGCDKIR